MDNYVYEPEGIAPAAVKRQNAAFAAEEARRIQRFRENMPLRANLKSLAAIRGVSKSGFGAEKALPPNVERRIMGFVSEFAPGRPRIANNVAAAELDIMKGRREKKLRDLARENANKYAEEISEEEIASALEPEAPADAVLPEVPSVRPAVTNYERRRAVSKSRARRGKTTNFRSKAPKPFAGNKTKRRNRSRSRGHRKGSKGTRRHSK
jgi:hypothetical protein